MEGNQNFLSPSQKKNVRTALRVLLLQAPPLYLTPSANFNSKHALRALKAKYKVGFFSCYLTGFIFEKQYLVFLPPLHSFRSKSGPWYTLTGTGQDCDSSINDPFFKLHSSPTKHNQRGSRKCYPFRKRFKALAKYSKIVFYLNFS